MKENTLKDFMQRLEKEKFYASDDIDELFERVVGLTSKYVGGVALAAVATAAACERS